MGFQGKQDEADGSPLAFDGAKEALALQGESSAVVVGLAVDEEDGRFDLVGERKRGHLVVDLRGLPVGAFLVLESERGKGAIVGTATAMPALNRSLWASKFAVIKAP